jgi:dTDP-glucose 4,6-dehydratase
MDTILVCGGAGFIGSNFVRHAIRCTGARVVVLDQLTYAGSLLNLGDVEGNPRFRFVRGDIGSAATVEPLLAQWHPGWIVNFAAATHVDRSIHAPRHFFENNCLKALGLLEVVRKHFEAHPNSEHRFLQVSTDETYGSLGPEGKFTEESPYAPNSPYAASKAAADHVVRAYHRTYLVPTLIANCANTYGYYQFPEKLIPLFVSNAMKGLPLTIYGDGKNIREWLFVEDTCDALMRVLIRGQPGDKFNIGGAQELTNLEVAESICRIMEEEFPAGSNQSLITRGLKSYRELKTFVPDRPGHDRRYASDSSKARVELGWQPVTPFEDGLRRTIRWYLDNPEWCTAMLARHNEIAPSDA